MPEDQIFGIRYGLRGFLDRHAKPVQLSRATVDGIQLKGGTVLVRGRAGSVAATWLSRCLCTAARYLAEVWQDCGARLWRRAEAVCWGLGCLALPGLVSCPAGCGWRADPCQASLSLCRVRRVAMPRCPPLWSGCASGASTTCELCCRAMLCLCLQGALACCGWQVSAWLGCCRTHVALRRLTLPLPRPPSPGPPAT